MNHREIQEKLHEYRDHELSDPERSEIEGHLARCHECVLILKRWETISRTLLKSSPEIDPENFVSRVMARLMDEPVLVPHPARLWPWSALVLAAAALLLIITMPSENSSPTTRNLLLVANGSYASQTTSNQIKWDDLLGINSEDL